MVKNNKNALIVVLIIGIISMTVAFAAISTQLNIFGTAKIESNSYKIVITNWQQDTSQGSLVSGQTNTGYQIQNATITNNTMTISDLIVGFKQPGDALKYTFNIENQGTLDAVLSSFNIETPVCKRNNETVACPNITQELKCGNPLTTPQEGTELNAGQTISCTYLIGYSEITEEGNNYVIEETNVSTSVRFTYSQASRTVHRLSFNAASPMDDLIYYENDEVDLPKLEKSGYSFDGWSDTEGATEAKYKANAKYRVTKDEQLYPVFIKVRYPITYNLDGGSASNPEGYYLDSEEITLNNPEKEGYTFTGWSGTDLEGNDNMEVKIATGSVGEREYTAHYTADGYTISYTLNGGSANNPESYNIESNIIILTNPTKTGYTFTGWSGTGLTGNNNQTVTIATGSTGDRSYEAHYTPVAYTISYTLNGGSATNETTYTIESNVITLNNPEKAGYTFTGWSGTDLEGEDNMEVTIAAGSTGDRSYEAHYTPISYTITYNLNGESATNESTYTIESNAITLNNPEKAGYTFTGWSGTGLTGNNNQTVTIATGSTGDRSYEAHYTPVAYTISYTLNGGSATNETTYTIESNAITLNNPTKEGYTFTGWSGTGLEGNNNMEVTIAAGSKGNRSYEAHYTPISYTITYNLNNGSANNPSGYNVESETIILTNPSKTVTVVPHENGSGASIGSSASAAQTFAGWSGTGLTGNNNQTVTIATGSTGNRSYTANWESVGITLPQAEKIGYTCTWYDSNNVAMGGSLQTWMPGNTSATSIDIYASCTANTYQVTFNNNTGSGGQSSAVTATYDSNMPSITSTAPTKTGYTFGGWYDTDASTGGTQYYTAAGASARTWNKTEDTVLYARWSLVTTTVSFSLNNGSGTAPSSVTATYDSAMPTLTSYTAPTRTGYTFQGWYDNATYTSGTKYYNTDGTSARTWNKDNATYTLYAGWKANTYNVTFNINGGSGTTPSAVTATYDAAMPALSTTTAPTKTGYSFTGWYDSSSGGTQYYSATGASARTWDKTASTTILYAQFSLNSYTATFNSQNGTNNGATITKPYGTALGTLPTTTRTGYTFNGWFTASSGGTQISSTTLMPLDGATYYAHWTANTYTVSFNLNSGSGTAPSTVTATYGSAMPSISSYSAPTRTGYTFSGFYDTSAYTGGTQYYTSSMTSARTWNKTSTTTLYARWVPVQKTATFNANSGTVTSMTKYSHTSNIDDSGKKLMNYGDSWGNSSIFGTDRTPSTQAHVVTISGASTLTVEVYYNGESVSYDWVTIWSGSHPTFTASSNYSNSSAVVQKLGGSQTGSYTVNGNSLTNMGKSTYTIQGDTVTFGFKTDSSGQGQGYGYYAIITGSISSSSVAVNKNYNEKFVTLPTASRTGYQFDGWFTSSSGGTQISESTTMPSSNTTYYAHWTAINYIATFHSVGGTNDGATITKPYGTALGTLPTTVKSGYEFDGWYTSSSGGTQISTSTTMPLGGTDYYAHWSLPPICKKATTLHTETCSNGSSSNNRFCYGDGYYSDGSKGTTTITYGHTDLTNGKMTVGYALDCKVSTSGGFTERFYYVSDYFDPSTNSFDSDYATLIYYKNYGSENVPYDTTDSGLNGPVTAVAELPTKSNWNNIELKRTSRQIYQTANFGSSYTTTDLPQFDYSGKAARFLTYNEVKRGCPSVSWTAGSLGNCNFLIENTKYSSSANATQGPWLENLRSKGSAWSVYSDSRSTGSCSPSATYLYGARPAIEVPYVNIQLN